MNLKNYSEKELLTEISKRINEGKIDWKFNIFFDADIVELKLICQDEQDQWGLTFSQPAQIEKGFVCRTVFKKMEPILIQSQQRKKREFNTQKLAHKLLFEALRKNIKKIN